ncbi:MAG: M42 family metallopeptidase [Anaerolineae bacterium]|nr:M42 family metallopeptidase [Anaerolineae bacterium]
MDLKLLDKLTQAFGPPGYEQEIRRVIRQEVTPLADEVWVDPLGSLVAHRKGTGKKLVLAAHMDEIGVMVTHVDEKGFLRFARMGGVHPLNCIGGRVRFANGTLGTIYVEHREDTSKPPTLTQLYIDVGATGREDAPAGVGDPAAFVRSLERQGNRIISKTLDDRVGCYVLIEVLRQLTASPYDLYSLFSVQEEVTLSGARTSAFKIDPDLALAVDVTLTGDTPKALPMAVELGKGPAVKVQDARMIAHPLIREMLLAAAQQAGVPYQLEILRGGTTDASAMQLVRAGVPSGCLSIPCRYVHSPSEMVDVADVENAVKLLLAAGATETI